MANNQQQQLAAKYFEIIDGFLAKLNGINLNRQSALDQKVHNWNVIATVLPIVMAIVSTFLVFLTKEALTSFTSLADVVPPVYVTRVKGNLDKFNGWLLIKNKLILLRGRIDRAALRCMLEGNLITEIDNELDEIAGLLK